MIVQWFRRYYDPTLHIQKLRLREKCFARQHQVAIQIQVCLMPKPEHSLLHLPSSSDCTSPRTGSLPRLKVALSFSGQLWKLQSLPSGHTESTYFLLHEADRSVLEDNALFPWEMSQLQAPESHSVSIPQHTAPVSLSCRLINLPSVLQGRMQQGPGPSFWPFLLTSWTRRHLQRHGIGRGQLGDSLSFTVLFTWCLSETSWTAAGDLNNNNFESHFLDIK